MPGVRVENSPVVSRRKRDISSWVEEDITSLGAREKKRYNNRKSAMKDYFTTDTSIDEITLRHHISQTTLQKLVEKCLMLHKDGRPWGFRALLPGAAVLDYAPENAHAALTSAEATANGHVSQADPVVTGVEEAGDEDTAKRKAILSGALLPTASPRQETTVETMDPETLDQPEEQDEATFVDPSPAGKVDGPISEEDLQVPEGEEAEAASVEATKPAGKEATLVQKKRDALNGTEAVTLAEVPADTEAAPAEQDEGAPSIVPVAKESQSGEVEPLPVSQAQETPDVEDVSTHTLEASEAQPALQDAAELEDKTQRLGRIPVRSEAADEDEESSQEFYADIEEMSPTVVDERMLPAAVDEEAGIAVLPGSDMTDLTVSPTAVLPLYNTGHYRLNGDKRAVAIRRNVRKRRVRDGKDRYKRNRWRTFLTLGIVAALLIGLSLPLGAGFAAYNTYNNLKGLATDGVNRLLTVKSLIPISKSDPMAALDTNKLQQAQNQFRLAGEDFSQLQQLVNRPDIQSILLQFAPQYAGKLVMARHLVQVAMDVTQMGDELSGVAQLGAGIIHGSPLATGSAKPLLTVADVSTIEGSLVHAQYYINDIRANMSQVSLQDLPVSVKQRDEIASMMALLPTAQNTIGQVQGLVGLVSWLLGVGGDRRYLIQTMDDAELRPGGGFTGQYGVLEIQNGRMAPFTLHDVTLIDYAENGIEWGRQAPPQYSWMNFGNFGLRDSNLSGDYPTTARLNMQIFESEGGGPVDGDIAFTPTFIGHILDITGPLHVGNGYNETITSKNLKDRLHFYQQDPNAIRFQQDITHSTAHDVRKAFTTLLGKLLLERMRSLSVSNLIKIGKGAIKDIQSRDLEIYFADPAAEQWLVDHGYSGAIDSYTNQDGFMVVQANISISKASQYVHTTLHDDVTLDKQGGATHNLTVTLDYQQKGPVYGVDTYADYVRIYAPPGAQFLGGGGFDSGHAICTPRASKPPTKTGKTASPTPPPSGCAGYIPPDGSRYCPSGNYSLGQRYQFPPPNGTMWPVDSLGPPTAMHSDLPGRSMWGGMTETPKNCTTTLTASWYVPHAVKKGTTTLYTLLAQKQGGYVPTLQLTIDASALHIKGVKTIKYNGPLVADTPFSVKLPSPKK